MKKLLIFVLLFGALVSCDANNFDTSDDSSHLIGDSESISDASLGLSNEGDEIDHITSETSADSSNESDEINHIKSKPIINEPINYKIVIDKSGTGYSDMPYYSRFGNNVYVLSEDEEGNIGTKKFVDGEMVAFYPNAYNVYEKNGELYGMVAHGDCICDSERSYCRLNQDGTHDVIIDCWQVFYSDDKIYYYDAVLDEDDDEYHIYVFSADVDGGNVSVVSPEVTEMPTYQTVIVYGEYLIYSDFIGGICVNTPDEEKLDLYSDYSSMTQIQFVNNGYVYYTECEYSTSLLGMNVYHSLWRVDLNGENRECIIEKQKYSSFDFNAVCFGEKMIVFAPEKIVVYNSDLSEHNEYDYGSFGLDKIEQICVYNNTMAISGWKEDNSSIKTLIYNVMGELVFEQ